MEKFKSPEGIEAKIDRLLYKLDEIEGEEHGYYLDWIIGSVPDGENDELVIEFLEMMAEKIGVLSEEMIEYAEKKAEDNPDE